MKHRWKPHNSPNLVTVTEWDGGNHRSEMLDALGIAYDDPELEIDDGPAFSLVVNGTTYPLGACLIPNGNGVGVPLVVSRGYLDGMGQVLYTEAPDY